MRWKPCLALALLLGLVLNGCASSRVKICKSNVDFVAPSKISFTDNEMLLLCGDTNEDSWKEIPPAQVEFTLRNYLKQRAYYHPTFSYENQVLSVDPGPLRMATELTFEGTPDLFDKIKIRDIIGRPLTSELLDKIQNFTTSRLKNLGYACPEVKIQASPETGKVLVLVRAGPLYVFNEAELADSLGLYPKTMRRFDAFQVDSPYRYEWVKLSSNRAENDGIVVSSQFNFVCPSEPLATHEIQHLTLNQTIMGGTRHLLTIGAGASTEEFPIAEFSLKSVRLNDDGANLQVTLYLSQRIQKLNTVFTDYTFKNAPRFDLAPNLTIEHDKETTYNYSQFQATLPFEYHGDLENKSWLISLGPSAIRQFSASNANSTPLTYFALLGRLNFTTHDYELYADDPRSGGIVDLNIAVLSDGTIPRPLATVYHLSGSKLIELNRVDPPQWVLGFRYGLATLSTDERPQTSTKIAPQYFNTLGGDQNLRGFGRNELALGTVGAMTSAYLGTEFRYAKTLPVGIEPFLFFDLGSLGSSPFTLDSTLYYSPGFGIRWSTPFGAIRATIAHGYVSKNANPDEEHLQGFLSFGREF